MSPAPQLILLFPEVPNAALLDLAMGLIGTWGCALHVAGVQVYFVDPLDHPNPFERPYEALPGAVGTTLVEDAGPRPEADGLMKLTLRVHPRGWNGRVELRHGPTLDARASWTFTGGAQAVVRGLERVLRGVARRMGVETPELDWRTLTFAESTVEAVETLRIEGAEALRTRLDCGRLGDEGPRLGGCTH